MVQSSPDLDIRHPLRRFAALTSPQSGYWIQFLVIRSGRGHEDSRATTRFCEAVGGEEHGQRTSAKGGSVFPINVYMWRDIGALAVPCVSDIPC